MTGITIIIANLILWFGIVVMILLIYSEKRSSRKIDKQIKDLEDILEILDSGLIQKDIQLEESEKIVEEGKEVIDTLRGMGNEGEEWKEGS